jgi:hypothetical protein
MKGVSIQVHRLHLQTVYKLTSITSRERIHHISSAAYRPSYFKSHSIKSRVYTAQYGLNGYLVNTLVTSIDQSVSQCKPPLRIRVIYLKKHVCANI